MNNNHRHKQVFTHIAIDFLAIGMLLALVFWDKSVSLDSPEFAPTLIFFISYGFFKLTIIALAGIYNIITNHFSIVDAC